MNQKQSWEEKLKELLDNGRTGLKESSDTNKTRYAILALFEQAIQTREREISEIVRNKADVEIRTTIRPIFHPSFLDGVNSGRIAAFTEVLSIINNKSL